MAMYFGGDFVAPNSLVYQNNLIPFKLGQITSLTKDDLKGLTEIEPYMFYWDWKLESIAIPNTVTEIGNYAFSYTSIKSLDIPESVTSISTNTFQNMLYLEYLDLSKYLGPVYLYSNMYSLKKLSLGNSSSINFSNFTTPSLEEITISDTNPNYFIKNNCLMNNKNSSNGKILYKGGDGANIPTDENITQINSYAFTNTNLPSNVVLPSTLTTLGLNAFYWVTGVESLTIPASVTSFNTACLYNIESLKSLTIEGDSEHTSISNYSFNYYFRYLPNLENLSINKNFTSSANYSNSNVGIGGNTKDGVSISFGNLVNTMPYGFLYWTPGTTDSTIQNLTKSIFSSNKGSAIGETIRSLAIPRTKIKEITNWGNITTINNYAFYFCDYKNIVIPNNITQINSYAYQYVYNTETVYYDANVTNINSYSNRILCSSYMNPEVTFTFGPNVTSIPSYLLGTTNSSYRTYFKHIRFTENSQVTELPTYFTAYNNTLTDCLIPASVEIIQSNAFSNCSSLETIYYEGSESDWNNITINDTSSYLANANKIYFNNHIHKGYVANADGTLTNTLGWRWDNNGNIDFIGDIGEWIIDKAAYPCKEGQEHTICNICNKSISRVIPVIISSINKDLVTYYVNPSYNNDLEWNTTINENNTINIISASYTYSSSYYFTNMSCSFSILFDSDFEFDYALYTNYNGLGSRLYLRVYINDDLVETLSNTGSLDIFNNFHINVKKGDIVKVTPYCSVSGYGASQVNTFLYIKNIKGPNSHTLTSWTILSTPTCSSLNSKSSICEVCGDTIYDYDPHNIIEDTCSICNQKIYDYEITASSTSYPNIQWEYLSETNSFECNCPTSYSWSGTRYLTMTFSKAGVLNFDYYSYFGSTSNSSYGRLRIYKNGSSFLDNITPTSDLKYDNYSINIEVGDIIQFQVYKGSTTSTGTGNVNYGARIKNITFKESFNEESN